MQSVDQAATVPRLPLPLRQLAFAEMLQALVRLETFPDGHAAGPVEIVQTHASAVLLAGDRAYKLKKPNDFGFFDYSTPALRRHFCSEEVRLNARLAPHVYLGVAPVLALADGSYRFAHACAPDAVPAPADELDGGQVVDYAVVMARLPEEATLEARVRADAVSPDMLAAVAKRVVAFHAASHTGEDIAAFGALDIIRHNWDENFAQMAPYVGRALDAITFDRLRAYVNAFLEERTALFEARVRTGRIRDCHGDLRMQHVYFLDDLLQHPKHPKHLGLVSATGASGATQDGLANLANIAIIDCIEFNERFRYGDVAAEVAFLTMELDAAGRPDLARAFTDAYIAQAGDEALRELLPFYACYRACVRGKVLAFQLDEPEVPADQREEARRQAQQLFALAGRYASGPTAPTLVLVGGLMGVGKSTFARRLAYELGWTLLSSDAVRKELAGVVPEQALDTPYGQGLYSQDWTVQTYRALLERAAALLGAGRSVILDASFAHRSDRQAAAEVAHTLRASAWFVECVCPPETALARLANRWRTKQSARGTGGATLPALDPAMARRAQTTGGLDASDGRPELYAAQASAWQSWDAAKELGLAHVRVDTGRSAAASTAEVLGALGITQATCWL